VWTTEGFAFQFLWPSHPDLATRLGPAISVWNAFFFIANCVQFCKPYDSRSVVRRILMGVLFFLAVWGMIPLIPGMPVTEGTMATYLSVYFSVNILVCILLPAYMVRLSRKHHIVLYFLFAVIVTISCSASVVLRGSGFLDLPFSTSTIMSTGYVIELILMTAGITRQFYNYRKEKEEALVAYAEQQKSISEKILFTQSQERNRISRELHDDIGPRLTRITLMSESVKRELPPESQPARELKEIADSTRQLVTSMGEIIWSLNPENMTLKELLSYLRDQLHSLLEHTGMHYEIEFNIEEDRELSHSVLRNTILITKEITHNAVKHSAAKQIHISCMLNEGQLCFAIKDDGVGIDKSLSTYGNGLRNIRYRINELGGTLHIDSYPNKGTHFSYSIPL